MMRVEGDAETGGRLFWLSARRPTRELSERPATALPMRMAMMAMTTSSSISVNPAARLVRRVIMISSAR